jgi:hypothetical protein
MVRRRPLASQSTNVRNMRVNPVRAPRPWQRKRVDTTDDSRPGGAQAHSKRAYREVLGPDGVPLRPRPTVNGKATVVDWVSAVLDSLTIAAMISCGI